MNDVIKLAYDTDSNYYDLSMPDPITAQDAVKLLDWLDWQQSLVPGCYQGDHCQIYDLEGYQAMISDYIHIRTEREKHGESIYPQNGPFIS
jgi:hypothetical protein